MKIGKLPSFLTEVKDIFESAILDEFKFVNIKNSHLFEYQKVPLLREHRDPFNRLLIATAVVEKAIILSPDKHFASYSNLIKVMW